jgi:DNA (cytosine-5)-methyltransferase 1
MNLYNEIDPYAAQWLRNLIDAGHIPPGVVDERSIVDLDPDELRGFTQCHFFAGIGGWSYALRLAGWPDDRPVWTGSCPCQPFSQAGAQRGSDDERHLWPAFFRLIEQCCPAIVFGEQVAGAAGLAWLDHVCADLEGAGYAAAAANLCAAGAGAPHIRQRLYWVAYAMRDPAGQYAGELPRHESEHAQRAARGDNGSWDCGAVGIVGDAGAAGLQARERAQLSGAQRHDQGRATVQSGGAWADLEWLACSDGKARPTQPGLFPLAYGVPNRVGRLRAYGNAIVPQVAAAFVRAV